MPRKTQTRRTFVDDEQIIKLFWSRDQSAVEQTDRKYGTYLFGIAYNILGDKADSIDCKNDTYVSAWNSIPPERPRALQAYLTRITRNFAIKVYNKRAAKKRVPSQLTVSLEELEAVCDSKTLEQEREAREIGRLISEYVSGLDERQRYAFTSRYYFAESVESIAKDLKLSSSAVYKELATMREGLKDHLERNGVYV